MRAGGESLDEQPAGLAIRPVRASGAPFPIWMVRATDAAPLWHLLSDGERKRALRFRTDALRNRYASAHAALRLLIERRTGLVATRLRFIAGADGKPMLADLPTLRHNISYGGDRALIALASGTGVGVDLELVRPVVDGVHLARECFTLRERISLRRSPHVDHRFLTIWVRKEACVKAIGHGLRQPLDSFQCGAGGAGVATVMIDRHRLRLGNLNLGNGYVGAWAQMMEEAAFAALPNKSLSGRASFPCAAADWATTPHE